MSGRPGRAAVLAGAGWLAFASGAPYTVVHELVPLWLRAEGMSLQDVGLLSLVGFAWTFKALWAPAVDRVGDLRAWAMGAMAAVIAAMTALVLVPPGPARVWALLGIALASATQDLAIDAWVTVRTPPGLRGPVTGLRVAAWRASMALVAGGAALAQGVVGWQAALGGVVALHVGLGAGMAFFARPPRAPAAPPAAWLGELGRWLVEPGTLGVLGLLLLYKLGDAAMAPMVKPFLLTRLEVGQVALLSVSAGAVLTAAGALAGGEVVRRWGLRAGLLGLGAVQALSNLVYAATAALPGATVAGAASVFESFTGGLGTAAQLALVMRAASAGQVATRFAICTALFALTRNGAGAVSGFAAESLGYASWFTITALLALPALALVPVVLTSDEP